MVCIIGGSGAGKTNAILNWLSRCSEKFYDIIIFNANSTNEPLYNLLKRKSQKFKNSMILMNYQI